MAALGAGYVDALREVLTSYVIALGDGGGKALAAKVPVHGFEAVSRLFLGLISKYSDGITFSMEEVNGAPAIIARAGHIITSIATFDYDGHRIAGTAFVVNPDKLAFARRQLAMTG